ncbi:C11orf68 [Symbiodinium sp. CCMP2592]|nr:C11orf68 [Symbiodinium sp. CCMP2592]
MEEAEKRCFMRIRPSAVDWNLWGILYAGRERIGIGAKLLSEFRGLRVASEWEKLSRQRDLSRTDLEHGLKQLSARHRLRKGKWLFYLPPPDTDRVWPELVWALSSGGLGEAQAVTVEPTGDEGEHLCCVCMDNCFDPSEAESVRSSLQALLGGLLTNVVLHLKPDIYAHCQIHRGNPWNLPPTLATCKMQGFKDKTCQALPHPCRHDREQLTPLLQAVEETMETAPLLLEKAQARDMLESLYAVALHPSAGDFPIVKMCAMVKEAGHIHGLLKLVGYVIRGLVGLNGCHGIWGYESRVFAYSEFKRMHLANAHLLGSLCMHGIIPAETVYAGLRRLDTESLRLPFRSTWAFVLQILRNTSRQLSEAQPMLSRRLETIVNSHPTVSSQDQLRVLTFNVWFDKTERELRTAALLCALQQLGPAICCFQEVTSKVAIDIQRALPTWTSSDPGDGSSIDVGGSGYGVMILAPPELRVRFSQHGLPTHMGRVLVVAELEGLAVGTVHLESLNNQKLRECQLVACAEVMQQWPDVLLVGDFNLFDKRAAQRCLQHQLPDFMDVWLALRKEPGNTFRSHGRNKNKSRIDRVMAKLSTWQAVDVELMFQQPMHPGPYLQDVLPSMCSNCVNLNPDVDTRAAFVSDHLGLLTTIEQIKPTSQSHSQVQEVPRSQGV